MVLPPRHGLSLCSGGGGLDMGLDLAEPGFATACFVEWEEYPRSVLIAAQRAGYFAPAPIWDNVRTFDGRPWRGVCDTVLAGYPCQPFSAAGQRKGENDPRHLWPDVARIIGEVQPEWVFLENVPGHVSLGLETVLRTLWDMGFTPAVGLFSASEVGAPHERLRVFIVAHSDGHADARGMDGSGTGGSPREGQNQGEQRERIRSGIGGGCGDVAHRNGQQPSADGRQSDARTDWRDDAGGGGGVAVANAKRDAGHQGGCRLGGDPSPRSDGQTDRPRPSVPSIFPPGPSDNATWAETLAAAPDLAPAAGLADCLAWAGRLAASLGQPDKSAVESRIRGLAYGLASRSRQLHLLGNGVVPLAAGYAWRTLSAAHGLGRVDLEAVDREDEAGAA